MPDPRVDYGTRRHTRGEDFQNPEDSGIGLCAYKCQALRRSPEADRTERGDNEREITPTSRLRGIRHRSAERPARQQAQQKLQHRSRNNHRTRPAPGVPQNHRAENRDHGQREKAEHRRGQDSRAQISIG